MKSFISSIALAGAVIAAPVFASGYGPAPKYVSSDGAPASQRGQSAQTLAVERKAQTTQETEYNTTSDAQVAAGNKTARSTASNDFRCRLTWRLLSTGSWNRYEIRASFAVAYLWSYPSYQTALPAHRHCYESI